MEIELFQKTAEKKMKIQRIPYQQSIKPLNVKMSCSILNRTTQWVDQVWVHQAFNIGCIENGMVYHAIKPSVTTPLKRFCQESVKSRDNTAIGFIF